MPIYEYQCKQCNYRFDKLQRVNATPLNECPQCQQQTLKKLVSTPRFKLQGTGWYETDFKDKKPLTKKTPASKEGKVEESPRKSVNSSTKATTTQSEKNN